MRLQEVLFGGGLLFLTISAHERVLAHFGPRGLAVLLAADTIGALLAWRVAAPMRSRSSDFIEGEWRVMGSMEELGGRRSSLPPAPRRLRSGGDRL